MPPKRRLLFPSTSSSVENPPIPAMSHQRRDGEEVVEDSSSGEEEVEDSGSGDESGSSEDLGGSVALIQPPAPAPPPPGQGGAKEAEGSSDDDGGTESESEYEAESESDAASSPKPAPPQPKGAVPSPKPSPLKRKAAAAELAEPSMSPPLKKAATVAVAKQHGNKSPPPPKDAAADPAATAAAEVVVGGLPEADGAPSGSRSKEDDRQKRLEAKRDKYWYLGKMLGEMEAECKQPGLFDHAFLAMEDADAEKLEKKVKKQWAAECQALISKRCDIKKEVSRAMCNLMN